MRGLLQLLQRGRQGIHGESYHATYSADRPFLSAEHVRQLGGAYSSPQRATSGFYRLDLWNDVRRTLVFEALFRPSIDDSDSNGITSRVSPSCHSCTDQYSPDCACRSRTKVQISVDVSKTGSKIYRNIFGQ